MGEAKRRNKNPRPPETDAKVVAVRDLRIDFPVPMRQNFLRVALNNARSGRNAGQESVEAFAEFLTKLFATERIVMVCYADAREPGGIGVVVAKGIDALQDDIKSGRYATAWTAFVVNDRDSAYMLGMEFGDMAMVTVPFDSDNENEMEAAVDKAHELAAYEVAKKRA